MGFLPQLMDEWVPAPWREEPERAIRVLGWATFGVWAMFFVFSTLDKASLQELTMFHRLAFDSPAFDSLLDQRKPYLIAMASVAVGLYAYTLLTLSVLPRVPLRWLCYAGIPAILAAAMTFPFDSTDYTVYINCGWMQAHYNLNPYVIPVLNIPGQEWDPMFRPHWTHLVSGYPPLFAHVANGIATLGMGNYMATFWLFKGLNLLCHLAVTAMAYWGARRLQFTRPELVLWGVGLSPFVLVHHLANMHNDLLVGFFLTLGLFLVLMGRLTWLVPCVAAAIMIKLVPVVVLPVMVVWMIQQKSAQKTVRLSVVMGLIVAGLSALPYVLAWKQIRYDSFYNGLVMPFGGVRQWFSHVAFEVLKWMAPVQDAMQGHFDAAFLLCCVVLYLWLMGTYLSKLVVSPRPTFQMLLEPVIMLQFWLIFGISTKLCGWYLGMFFPLIWWMLPSSRMRRFLIVLSTLQTFAIMGFGVSSSEFNVTLLACSAGATYLYDVLKSQSLHQGDWIQMIRARMKGLVDALDI